jgi:nitroreductase
MTFLVPTNQKTFLRRAAVRATYAPSVHNTQPWRLVLSADRLLLHADRSRQLHVLDPMSRQLTISCGCALFNARVSLAADGVALDVVRFPDPARPDLIAELSSARDPAAVDHSLAPLDPVIEVRQTNRREFADADVPSDVLEALEQAALAEGAHLVVVHDDDQRIAVATLSQHADAIEHLNPAYRAELRAWTTDDPARLDGVPDVAVPHVDAGSEDDVPIRDFDTYGSGGLPVRTRSSLNQCLVFVCTDGDSPMDWLVAGEALERVLLEVTRHGYAASPLTQVTEVPSARAQIRQELRMVGYPHVLLRIGRAPVTPSSRRRHLVDVLAEEE